MALAAGLQLPLVLVIDTAGPALSAEAEQGGLAGEIARCLADLVTLDTPTVSVLLGQGSGGPALAMVPADRVLAALHGWLAPLPPEGASAIVFRDVDHAPELAAAQGIRSADLLRNGIVDAIVPERPDAADEPLGVHQAVVGDHRQRIALAACGSRRRAVGRAAAALPAHRLELNKASGRSCRLCDGQRSERRRAGDKVQRQPQQAPTRPPTPLPPRRLPRDRTSRTPPPAGTKPTSDHTRITVWLTSATSSATRTPASCHAAMSATIKQHLEHRVRGNPEPAPGDTSVLGLDDARSLRPERVDDEDFVESAA